MIRKLGIVEQEQYCQHLLRLGAGERRLRFCGTTSEAAIRRYCAERRPFQSLMLGLFSDGVLRGVGELIFDHSQIWRRSCEAALSVESQFQNLGVGTELFRRLISAASNRGVELVRMLWLKENLKMEAMAAKFEPKLSVGLDQIECEIQTTWPTMFTILEEIPTSIGLRFSLALRSD